MSTSIPTSAELAAIPRISAAEARAAVEGGRGVLVDTRDRRLYDNAHATSAVSLPLREVDHSSGRAQLKALPSDQTLILYCT